MQRHFMNRTKIYGLILLLILAVLFLFRGPISKNRVVSSFDPFGKYFLVFDPARRLNSAVIQNDADEVKACLDARINPNLSGEYYGAPLNMACFNNNPVIVKLLLDAGADPNIDNELAPKSAQHQKILKKIMAESQKQEEQFDRGMKERIEKEGLKWTPIPPNAPSRETDFPLERTSRARNGTLLERRLEVLKLLLKAGADPNGNESVYGSHLVAVSHWENPALRLEALKLLLEKGANPELKSGSLNQTAMYWAVRNDDPDAVRLLAKNGAKLNVTNEYQLSYLSEAAHQKKFKALEALLEAGADPAIGEVFGSTIYETVLGNNPALAAKVKEAENAIAKKKNSIRH